MPRLMASRLRLKRLCTQSRSTRREARNAIVAPMLEAKDTMSVPQARPKIAPPSSVSTVAAPASDRPVSAMYSAK